MGHTPYGYKIENGAAVIDETEACCVRQIFDNYISGMSLREAASAAGHPLVHSTVKRIWDGLPFYDDPRNITKHTIIVTPDVYSDMNKNGISVAEWAYNATNGTAENYGLDLVDKVYEKTE